MVYSYHDVTTLSLLYGVGAKFLVDEERGQLRFWPSCASTLVFELVRVQKETGSDSTCRGNISQQKTSEYVGARRKGRTGVHPQGTVETAVGCQFPGGGEKVGNSRRTRLL